MLFFIFNSHFRKHWNATVVMVTARFPTRLMSLMFLIPRSVYVRHYLNGPFATLAILLQSPPAANEKGKFKTLSACPAPMTVDEPARSFSYAACLFTDGGLRFTRPSQRGAGGSEQPMLARF